MPHACCLLADLDAGDIIKIVVFLVVFGIGFLNWLAGKVKKMAQPPAGPVARPPMAPRAPQGQAVDAEIEEFLRRAAQARGQAPPQPARPPQPAAGQPPRMPQPGRAAPPPPARGPQPGTPFGPRSQPARRKEAQRPPAREPVIEAQVVEPRRPLGTGVEQHVRQHLDTREFEERGARLSDVDQADEAMEARIHQSLDHQVGSMVLPTDGTAAAPLPAEAPSVAGAIRAMFADPASIRRAFIVQEILRRPTF
jgi:hypothetical protein